MNSINNLTGCNITYKGRSLKFESNVPRNIKEAVCNNPSIKNFLNESKNKGKDEVLNVGYSDYVSFRNPNAMSQREILIFSLGNKKPGQKSLIIDSQNVIYGGNTTYNTVSLQDKLSKIKDFGKELI